MFWSKYLEPSYPLAPKTNLPKTNLWLVRELHRVFALLTAGALAIGTVSRAAAAPDPYQIFANARAFWTTQHYPQRLEYTVAIAVTEGGAQRVERYDADYDAVKDTVTVDPVSDYQREHPPHPRGIDLGLLGFRLNKPMPSIDFLGVPHVAPTYSFGMAPFVPAPTPTPFNSAMLVNEIRQEFHDPNPRTSPSPSPSPSHALKEIATVVARNRDYWIALLGTQTIDGHPCFHLALRPLHDPGRYRIRQAWIDETTFAPWQLEDRINFVSGPGTTVSWLIRFADVGGAHYIEEEDAQAPMSAGGEIYTKAAVRFEDIHAVTASTIAPQIAPSSGATLDEPSWP